MVKKLITILSLVLIASCSLLPQYGSSDFGITRRNIAFVDTSGGGCGILATKNIFIEQGMSENEFTQEEFNVLARELEMDKTGGVSIQALFTTWKNHGLDPSFPKPLTNCVDYSLIIDSLKKGCSVALFYLPTGIESLFIGGHVETVASAYVLGRDTCSITTNTWGKEGEVHGGTGDHFTHSIFQEYAQKTTAVFYSEICSPE